MGQGHDVPPPTRPLACQVLKLQQDLQEQNHTNTRLLAESGNQQVELQARQEEVTAAKAEVAHANKVSMAATMTPPTPGAPWLK